MGIRDRIKKKLPIFGGNAVPSAAPRPAPAAGADAPAPVPDLGWSAPEPVSARGDAPAKEFVQSFVTDNKIAIFMKGSPAMPQCGFSANASSILRSYDKPLAHFDVLSDPDVRQAVKEFSEWPTIPQIYVNGEFLGGSDILMQMHQNGELKEAIAEAYTESS